MLLWGQGFDIGDQIVDIAPTERHAGHGGVRRGQPGLKSTAALVRIRSDRSEGRGDITSWDRAADQMAAGAPFLGQRATIGGVAGISRDGGKPAGKRSQGRHAGYAATESGQPVEYAMDKTGFALCHDRFAAPPVYSSMGRTMWREGDAGIDLAQAGWPAVAGGFVTAVIRPCDGPATTESRSDAGRRGDVRRLQTWSRTPALD